MEQKRNTGLCPGFPLHQTPGLLPGPAGEGGRGAMGLSCPEPPLPPGHLCEPDLLLLRDELKLRVQVIHQGLFPSLGRILGAYLCLTL